MKRGQAFDTMMLVISVIVAIAILAILLGFITGIGSFGTSAKDVIPDKLKKINSAGYGIELVDSAQFKSGDIITNVGLVKGLSILAEDLHICCDSSLCPTSKDPLSLSGTGASQYLKVVRDVKAAIAVCSQDSTNYFVAVYKSKDGASSICEKVLTASSPFTSCPTT